MWSEALDALRSRGASYAVSQLERLKPLSSDNGTLKLGVADRFFRDWVDEHYRSLLEDALASTGAVSQVEFEIVELPDHPWFLAVQFHPELRSRPHDPHPLFRDFVRAALDRRLARLGNIDFEPSSAEPTKVSTEARRG